MLLDNDDGEEFKVDMLALIDHTKLQMLGKLNYLREQNQREED